MKRRLLCLLVALALASPTWAENCTVILDIPDMDCSLCVTAINQALRQIKGVIKAKASLPKKQAEVIVPPGFDLKLLEEAVAKTGYRVGRQRSDDR